MNGETLYCIDYFNTVGSGELRKNIKEMNTNQKSELRKRAAEASQAGKKEIPGYVCVGGGYQKHLHLIGIFGCDIAEIYGHGDEASESRFRNGWSGSCPDYCYYVTQEFFEKHTKIGETISASEALAELERGGVVYYSDRSGTTETIRAGKRYSTVPFPPIKVFDVVKSLNREDKFVVTLTAENKFSLVDTQVGKALYALYNQRDLDSLFTKVGTFTETPI